MGIQKERTLSIAHLGQKTILDRSGGIEVVVKELATRMVIKGHKVTCYNRGNHHMHGIPSEYEKLTEYHGVRLKNVPSLNRRGVSAVTSSIAGAVCAAFGKYDVVHFHAEGPALMCWLPKLFEKRVIVTVHGECEIIGSTGEKPVKSRLHKNSVFHPNSNTEYHIRKSYSGFLKRFCFIPELLWCILRIFFCWNILKAQVYHTGIA